MSERKPESIPECGIKPLRYHDWQKEFCPTDNVECQTEEAFATAVKLGISEIPGLQETLQQEGLELSPDLTKIKNLKTGKERSAQEMLTRLVYKEGRSGRLSECQAHPEKTILFKYRIDPIHGVVETSCQTVIDEIIAYLHGHGYSPTKKPGVFAHWHSHEEKTLVKAAQEMDMAEPNLLRLFQSQVAKLKNQRANYEKLLAGFKEGLEGASKIAVNPLAPIVGCYTTKMPGLTLCLTQDPVEIALKSTGRCWEGRSCERITGVFSQGFIDDIANHAVIAFGVKTDTGEVLGRKMIRWGIDRSKEGMTHTEMQLAVVTRPEKLKYCAGVEPIWYEAGMTQDQQIILDERIAEVLQCNKLVAETCVTPYAYRGYSDAMGAGNLSALNYGMPGIVKRGQYLLGYLHAFYRDNVPFIFNANANALNYAQTNLLLQHDFRWTDRPDAAAAFYIDAHRADLPYFRIKDFSDIAEHSRCRATETEAERVLSTKERGTIERIGAFLRETPGAEDITAFTKCLDPEQVSSLLAGIQGDIRGEYLFLDVDNDALFTEESTSYQQVMDEYLDHSFEEYWYIIEQKFGEH